ncbi:MAG: purine nucleoside permease [Candidatus Bipolaricaulota bacterium]
MRKRTISFLAVLMSMLVLVSVSGVLAEVEEEISVKVMIFSMFEIGDYRGDFAGEFQHWVEEYNLDQNSLEVKGAYGPVLYNDKGVAGTVIGIGKSNAATSVTAILLDPRFDFSQTYFLTSGCSGTPPEVGTLGSVFWAPWVVDYDLTHRMSPSEGDPVQPLECNPELYPHQCKLDASGKKGVTEYETYAYKLNEKLVKWALDLSKNAELADSSAAKEYRNRYLQETARRDPFIDIGTTITGDTYFHGPGLSEQAQEIVNWYNAGTYSTTQMEDYATALALERFGYLDRYLSKRSVVNFDQPYPDQTTQSSLEANSGGFSIGMENALRAGKPVVDHIIENWETWANGVPDLPSDE